MPEASLDSLDADVTAVRAVSGTRAQHLSKLGIRTVRDLLRWYPHRYIDLSVITTAAAAPLGQTVTVIGRVEGVRNKQPRRNMHVLECALVDETGAMGAVWFRQPWMAKKIKEGDLCAFSGKVYFDYGMKRMNSPYVEVLGHEGDKEATLGMIPVHHASGEVSTSWMRRLVANALELAADMPDTMPAQLRQQRHLMSRKAAFRSIHFPADAETLERAHERLAYEEVLCLQLEMMLARNAETRTGTPTVHARGTYVSTLTAALPFQLTDEQQLAVDDILADMESPSCMNRMLLGDVGTGKTIVSAFALACCADSACQSAMMAPTEVLARQYANSLGPVLDRCGMTWAVLTGSTQPQERDDILSRAADGSLQVLFGTHALIEPDVTFAALGLVVIDEQHRFGVGQRAALRAKGSAPDLLVMTATPIPRTLALTLYGDLETSFIRKRPANRPPVTTRVISRDQRGKGYDAIRQALKEGRQAYIVCPLVGLSSEQRAAAQEDGTLADSLLGFGDVSKPKAAQDEAAFLAAKVFPGYSVGLLTGRMKPVEKQQVMDDFRNGSIDVLVATTVIEVGVDVPNATVMMIEDSERFGLSQLHQLRGRVGRGAHPGTVFLVADPGKDDEELQQRLQAMVTCEDGFELAEADLRARREGNVLGTRQHGNSVLRLVNVIDDAELVQLAHADAKALLRSDPDLTAPEHAALAREVAIMFTDQEEPVRGGA